MPPLRYSVQLLLSERLIPRAYLHESGSNEVLDQSNPSKTTTSAIFLVRLIIHCCPARPMPRAQDEDPSDKVNVSSFMVILTGLKLVEAYG